MNGPEIVLLCVGAAVLDAVAQPLIGRLDWLARWWESVPWQDGAILAVMAVIACALGVVLGALVPLGVLVALGVIALLVCLWRYCRARGY